MKVYTVSKTESIVSVYTVLASSEKKAIEIAQGLEVLEVLIPPKPDRVFTSDLFYQIENCIDA